jgi:hypothetical protein
MAGIEKRGGELCFRIIYRRYCGGGEPLMRYEISDMGGFVPWMMRLDGSFLVDRRYLAEFLAEILDSTPNIKGSSAQTAPDC